MRVEGPLEELPEQVELEVVGVGAAVAQQLEA